MTFHPRLPYEFSDEMVPDLIMLLDMLSYCRPHGSRTERQFIKRFITPTGVKSDSYGNLHLAIGDAPVMWSCHTDTVHSTKGLQQLAMTKKEFCLGKDAKSSCLGADDTAGVWLMLEMINAKVPGLYVFHRNEEHGRVGSMHFAKQNKELVEKCSMAIALDRRGQNSVITHQMGSRCCSDDFGNSLREGLDIGMTLDSGGSFTDTASYTDLIGECTNLSVGYTCAHSRAETLNFEFLFKLRDALCRLDTSKLALKRKAGEVDRSSYYDDCYEWGYGGYGNYGGHTTPRSRWHSNVPAVIGPNGNNGNRSVRGFLSEEKPVKERDIISMVKRYPDIAADILEQHGFDAKEFGAYVMLSYYDQPIPY